MNSAARTLRNICFGGALLWQLGWLHCETLVVFSDENYPPIVYIQDGKPAGKFVEILRRASQITGDRYDLQLFPWKRAYEQARQGLGAVIGVSLNAERSEIFDFSDPLYNDDLQIVVLKDRPFKFTQLVDLKGKTLGGVLGASYGDMIDKAIEQGLFFVDRDLSQVNRLKMLLAQRIDGAIIGNGMEGFEAILQSDPELYAQRTKLTVLKTPLARDPLYLAIAKSMNKKPVIERFNKALRALQLTGDNKRSPGVMKASN